MTGAEVAWAEREGERWEGEAGAGAGFPSALEQAPTFYSLGGRSEYFWFWLWFFNVKENFVCVCVCALG